MKKILTILFCISALGVAAFAQNAKAVPGKKEMTVKDYFLQIPTEFMNAPAAKRSAWIETNSASIGHLSFKIPITEISPEASEADGSAFGDIQVFKKTKGGVMIGLAMNLCAENTCTGQIKFLDVSGGKYTDVTEDFAPIIDNDEVITVLRNAPAFKKTLKDSVEVPLAIQFSGNDKLIQYIAGAETSTDGGVVAIEFKWNGSIFVQFQTPESPI